jgi:hypothetical protein
MSVASERYMMVVKMIQKMPGRFVKAERLIGIR